MNRETEEFIRENADGDVRLLALQKAKQTAVDMPFALCQIAGRQAARRKLPTFAAAEGIIYPPHLSLEQCSSEQTARYKAAIAQRLGINGTLTDLTGGFGVDFFFLAQGMKRAVYVEQQAHLCDAAETNFKLLGLTNANVKNADSIEILHQMEPVSLVFLDPARRDGNGARTYSMADCTPNVPEMLDELLRKAEYVMLKLSPMLDWHKAVEDLKAVTEVHIVSVANECKELLLVLSAEHPSPMRLFCVNDGSVFECPLHPKNSEEWAKMEAKRTTFSLPETGGYLYEPNSSIMKAGCFDALSDHFGIHPVGNNSHLFASREFIASFPGRKFQIPSISSMNKRDLRELLKGLKQANITVRNFPLSVAELRKRLRLRDGGNVYIFATTDMNGRHILIKTTPPDAPSEEKNT